MKQDIFKCNLYPADIQHYSPAKSAFWTDVLSAWSEFRKTMEDESDVNAKSIWWNTRIRINGKPFFFRKAYLSSLMWVSQLVIDGKIISQEKAETEYKLNFLDYSAILQAIPKDWLQQLKEGRKCDNESIYAKMLMCKDLSKKVYRTLASLKVPYSKKVEKWKEDIGEDFTVEEFNANFRKIYLTTNYPKLRSFQYRTLHRALVLNIHLFHWGMRSDNRCSFCQKEKETMKHLFIECGEVQKLWESVKSWVNKTYGRVIYLAEKSIFFNCADSDPKSVVNLLILICKQYIYGCRCTGESLNADHLIIDIEKYIAIKNENTSKFKDKWVSTSNDTDQID